MKNLCKWRVQFCNAIVRYIYQCSPNVVPPLLISEGEVNFCIWRRLQSFEYLSLFRINTPCFLSFGPPELGGMQISWHTWYSKKFRAVPNYWLVSTSRIFAKNITVWLWPGSLGFLSTSQFCTIVAIQTWSLKKWDCGPPESYLLHTGSREAKPFQIITAPHLEKA